MRNPSEIECISKLYISSCAFNNEAKEGPFKKAYRFLHLNLLQI